MPKDPHVDLAEGLDPERLRTVLAALDGYAVPEPTVRATRALVERLRPVVPPKRSGRFREHGLLHNPFLVLLHFLMAQRLVFRPAFWALTALATVVGVIALPGSLPGLPAYAVAAPVIIGGVAYGFRYAEGGGLEIEMSAAMGALQMLLARVAVVAGWEMVLGLAMHVVLPTAGLSLAGWAATVLGFSGLTLLLSLLMGTRPAVAAALVAWAILLLFRAHGYLWSLFPWAGAATGAACVAGSVAVVRNAWRPFRRRAAGEE